MRNDKTYQVLINTLLIILTLIMVLPLLLLFIASITDENVLIAEGYSYFPRKLGFSGYAYILRNMNTIVRAYGMTIFVTAVGTSVGVLLTMMTAFPLSITKLPGRGLISFYFLFTMLFSGGLVPSYIMWVSILHIKNTVLAYLLPNLLLGAVNIILMRTYYQNSIPSALYEAAEIDGASYPKIFTSIVIPLGKPIVVTIALFSGLGYWNDWTNGLYYVDDSKLYTIQVLLNEMIENLRALQQTAATSGGSTAQLPSVSVRMAIAFVALFPVLVIYPFLQKYFASGIMLGAVKG